MGMGEDVVHAPEGQAVEGLFFLGIGALVLFGLESSSLLARGTGCHHLADQNNGMAADDVATNVVAPRLGHIALFHCGSSGVRGLRADASR